MPKSSIKIFHTAKNNVKRNRWLSFSTIFVTIIVFAISSSFISIALLGQKAVKHYEEKSQVIVFLKKDTPESEILLLRDKLYNPEYVKEITYVSQEEALAIYQEDFADNPDLIATVTADSLPPSLELKAHSIDALITTIENIDTEKQSNAYIDEVMYFKDVVSNLRTLSRIINIGAAVLISILATITFIVIRITIGFNINAHKDEIKIMHLVGSTDKFIRFPFVIEGAFYGLIGATIAAILILVPWYIIITYIQGTEYALWINQMLSDFGVDFLQSFNLTFTLIYFLIHIGAGIFLGTVSSLSGVRKYLIFTDKDE